MKAAFHGGAMPPHCGRPHVLAVPFPYQGHVNPLLEFCKRLVSAGFMVTFANTTANHKKMQGFVDKSSVTTNLRGGTELHFVSLEDGLPAEYDRPEGLLTAALSPHMKASVRRLLVQLCQQEPRVSILLHDLRLVYMQDLATDARIPNISFWTQSAASFACNLLVAQGFQLPPDDSTLINCVEGVPPFKRSSISGVSFEQFPPPCPVEEYTWEPFRRIHEPAWVVLNTFKELEDKTMDTLQRMLGFCPIAVGPVVNTPLFSVSSGVTENSSHLVLEWLDHHPPASVLYIAFGTVTTLSEEQLEELLLGLEASQQPLLWVFRPDLCRNSKKYTVELLAKRCAKQGMVVPWAPQWHVLSHPAVGGFLTHCGWNSTLEGITAGLPMLAWPGLADQFLNGLCLEQQWGIGLGFEGGGALVTRSEVHKKVTEMMQGEGGRSLRSKARSLSSAARQALEEGGSSYCGLSQLTQALQCSTS